MRFIRKAISISLIYSRMINIENKRYLGKHTVFEIYLLKFYCILSTDTLYATVAF
jgi:hypothetical protein